MSKKHPILFAEIHPFYFTAYTYTWEMGRQLATMSKTGQNLSFKYNDSGIRTEKTVNGVTTKYHLLGNRVTYEDNGIDKIYYTYDGSGKLVSMNLNGTEYYYIRNAQGDIIGLFDATGTQVVTYTYDTWGKLVSITGSLASTVGAKNSYRYRGYRYDTETGLYYLQSRYYNPEWGRFINADALLGQQGGLLSHNLFAYCFNNPVNMADPDGDIAWWIVGGAAGAVAGGIYSYATTGKVDWRYVAGGALMGAGVGWAASALVGSAGAASSWATASSAIGAGANAATKGRVFEKWFYDFYKVGTQQISTNWGRIDAFKNGVIYELKNYDWSKYKYLNSVINDFVAQATKYQNIKDIAGQKVTDIVFFFSSKPPQDVINALSKIGVTVDWVK